MTDSSSDERMRQVASALYEGRLPTSGQMVEGIEEFQKSGTLQKAREGMSTDTQKVLLDTERLVEDTRKTIKQKIPGNELQNVIYYSTKAGQNVDTASLQYDAQTTAQQLVDAGAKAANLAKTIVTSGEFRSLLQEVSAIVQEVLRDNIHEASDEFADDPNVPEEVRNAARKTRDELERTDLSGAAQDVKGSAQQKAGELKDQAKDAAYGAKEDAQNRYNDASARAQDTTEATKRRVGDTLDQGASLRDTAKAAIDVIADKAEEHLPPDTVNKISDNTRAAAQKAYHGELTSDVQGSLKDQAIGLAQDLKDQAQSTYSEAVRKITPMKEPAKRAARKLADLPDDKRDEIITRFRVVSETLQNKPEIRQAFDELMMLVNEISNKASLVADTAVKSVAEVSPNPNELPVSEEAKLAVSNAKQLIENFANGKSLDNLIEAIRDFANTARTDDALQSYWTDLASYLKRAWQDKAYTESNEYKTDAKDLIKRSRTVLSDYGYYTTKIAWEASGFANALASDRATQKLAGDVNALVADLFLDERGNPAFKPELLRDLAKLVPAIANKLAYLPVPRVETDDGTYHMIMDNILLKSTILPRHVHIATDTTLDANANSNTPGMQNTIYLEISDIEVSARNIAWLVNKHSGFFQAGDVGLCDFDVKSPGLKLRIKCCPGSALPENANVNEIGRFLNIQTIDATLSNLSLRLHDTHRDFLYKLLNPIITARAKKSIEDAVQDGLRQLLLKFDHQVGRAVQSGSYEIIEGPPTAKGIPEWGSKAFGKEA